MFYTYNKSQLKFEPVRYSNYLKTALGIFTIAAIVSFNVMEVEDYERILEINISGEREFSEEKLVRKLKELELPYPHIVLAQAKLESNNYSSRIFIDSHNLFGMKEARVRINTAKGTQYNHAYYGTWQESVLDYAFWMATYGSKCKTEQQYYNLLSGYAEDPNYQAKLKSIINKHKLKDKFN
jgi:uncharacterized FlgJ-related protein